MMPDNAKAFHRKTREFSIERALAILNGLRSGRSGSGARRCDPPTVERRNHE
jgi:hypothetical protein